MFSIKVAQLPSSLLLVSALSTLNYLTLHPLVKQQIHMSDKIHIIVTETNHIWGVHTAYRRLVQLLGLSLVKK